VSGAVAAYDFTQPARYALPARLAGVVMDTTQIVMDTTLITKDTTPNVTVSSSTSEFAWVGQLFQQMIKKQYMTIIIIVMIRTEEDNTQ
jgi:hypothetical protein